MLQFWRRLINQITHHPARVCYVMAVRANHVLTTGSGRTVTAAEAVRMIPHHAWHRMRTGSGTKGTRHHDWAMLGVTSDDTPGGHGILPVRRRRYTGKLSLLDTRAGPAVPADRNRGRPLADRKIISSPSRVPALDAGQVIRWKSWHRRTAICLLACIYLRRCRRAAPAKTLAQSWTPG